MPALDQVLAPNSGISKQLQAFLLSCKVDGYTKQTLDGYQAKLRLFVRFADSLRINHPSEVTANEIRLFLLHKKETCNAVTIHDHYRVLRRFFNWMVDEGIVEKTPMASMKPPRVPKPMVTPFNSEHIKTLLLFCDDRTFLGARNKAIILTFLDTGLRLSELADIQLQDIDFDHETIKVMGKGAKERIVRVGKAAQKALLRYLLMRDDELPCLWLSEERRPLTAWGVERMIQNLGKRARFTDVRCSPHTFRHTFGTQALRNGASVYEVQSLLGHSTLDMTRRYTATLNSEDAVISHRKFSPVDNLKLK